MLQLEVVATGIASNADLGFYVGEPRAAFKIVVWMSFYTRLDNLLVVVPVLGKETARVESSFKLLSFMLIRKIAQNAVAKL